MSLTDDNGEIEGGIYQFKGKLQIGAAKAEMEQKRSELIDALRTSNFFCVSIHNEDNGEVIHSSFISDIDVVGEDNASCFLAYAVLKALQDMAEFMDLSREQAAALVVKMIDDGVGENWK